MREARSVSIALATHNGSRYLTQLLDSLAAQRLSPLDLVASDDASEDDTLALLEAFAARAPFPVHVLRNSKRLGVVENFSRAIAACSGDCIALADQDDVWRQDKLDMLAPALAAPESVAAFSDASVVDVHLAPLGYKMWQRVRFTATEQERLARGEAFAVLLKHHIVTGATLAFKSHLRDYALPVPDGWAHDAWLGLLAAAQGRLVAVPEPLIAYRQHHGNVVGAARTPLLEQVRKALLLHRSGWYAREIALWKALAERLESLPEHAAMAGVREAAAEKLNHLERRSSLPPERWRRVPGVLHELCAGHYSRYARNWGSVALDLFRR